MVRLRQIATALFPLACPLGAQSTVAAEYRYFRAGNPSGAPFVGQAGIAPMGGRAVY
jgi:hypothetical protein